MGMEELIQGLAALKEGATILATSRAINNAQEQMQQLQGAEMDKGQLMQAQTQVGNDLAMRLTQAGADAGRVAQVVGQLAPSAGAQFQADQNMELQKNSQNFQASENSKSRASSERIAGMGIEKAEKKLAEARRKELGMFATTYQKEFNSLSKKNMDSRNSAKQAAQVLRSGNPIGDSAVKMMLARAVQGGAQLSDAEREVFGGSKAVQVRAQQIAEEMKTGKMSAPNRAYMLRLVAQLEQAADRNIMKSREQVAGQAWQRASKTGHDFSRDEIADMIYEVPKPQAGGGAGSDQKQGSSMQTVSPNGKKPGSLSNYLE